MLKKIGSLFLLLILLLTLSGGALAAGTTLTVEAPASLPAVGQTYTVKVCITGNPGLCAAQFTLAFDDTVADCLSAKTGSILSGMLSATNPDADGGAIVAAAATNAKTGDGVLAEYTFKVLKSGDPAFRLTDGLFTGADGKAVATNVTAPAADEPGETTETQSGTEQSGTQDKDEPGTETDDQKDESKTEAEGKKDESKTEAEGKKDESKTKAEGKKDETKTGGKQGATQPIAAEEQTEAAPAAQSFTDVSKDYWGYGEIEKAVSHGLLSGYEDGSFRPQREMTRAEFVTILYRLAGSPEVTVSSVFRDVPADAWFAAAVSWAAEKGYVTGDGVNFDPYGRITRQQVVTILCRYDGGVDMVESIIIASSDPMAGYSDKGGVAGWAQEAMRWALYHHIMSGTSETTLSPTGTALRAQVAAFFVRYIEK